MSQIARWLMFTGALIFLIGLLILIFSRWLPLGRLPGDIVYQRGNFTCVFPLATSLLLSVVLTVLFNLLARWLGK